MSNGNESSYEKDMNFTDHLTELRKRLIWTAAVFVVFFVLGFVYVKEIYGFFVNDLDFTLNVISPGEIIWIYVTMASLIGLVATLPFLSLQIWLFVRPGLTPKERKVSLSYIPAVFLLFIGGLSFGYFVFIRFILPFLLSLNEGMFNEMFTVNKYFGFLFSVTLPFGILFEIPILTMFLTSLGIVTPDFLKRTRKYAYLILVIIGAMISPPDFILQIVVAIPLIILYEVSVVLARFTYKKKQAEHEKFMDQEES